MAASSTETKSKSQLKREIEDLTNEIKALKENSMGNTTKIYTNEETKIKTQHYQSLFVNNHSVMLLIDPETGEIKDANNAACKFYGWTFEELLKKKISQINILSKAEVKAEMKKAKAEKRNHFIFRHKLADGQIRDVEVYSGPISIGNTTLLYSLVHDITDRKTAEEKLQQSEDKYRNLIESINDVVYQVTTEGTVKYVSNSCESILGYTSEEVTGKNLLNYIHPDDRQLIAERLTKLSKKDYDYLEYRYINKLGETHWVRSSTTAIIENEIVTGAYGTLTDITERKLAEEKLLESKQIIEGIINTIPARVFWKDKNLVYMGCNTAFAVDAGYTDTKDVIGKDDFQFLWHEQAEAYRNDDKKVIETGLSKLNIEEQLKTADGKTISLFTNKTPLTNADGEVTGVLGTFMDITERKQAEEKIRRSEEKYRLIFENMLDVYYEASLDGTVLEISPSIEIISNGQYNREESIGKNMSEVYHDFKDREAFFNELTQKGKVNDYELILKNKDGSIVLVSISASLVFDKNGKPLKIAGTMRDITERKASEAKLKESELQYRTLANSGQALIWTAAPDKKCNYFNQIWLDFTGRTLEQELGDGWAEGVHPDDLDRCFTIYSNSFDERKPFSMDYRLRYHDGTYRWLQDDGKPRYNSEGDFIGYIGHCLDITDRIQASEKLDEKINELAIANNQLTLAQQIGRTGSWSYNLESGKLKGSIESIKLFGLGENPEDFTVENVESCIPESERVVQASYDLMEKGTPYDLEYEIHPADGSPARIINSKAEMKYDVEGNAVQIFGVFQDITGRKQIERSLLQSEQKYKALFFDSPDGYLIISDGKFIECNRASEMLMGGNRSSIIGKTPDELSPGFQPNGRNSVEYAKEIIEETFVAGKSSFEWTHTRVDGTEFQLQINLSVIEYDGKKVLFTSWRDITERIQTENELRRSEEKYRFIAERSNDLIYIYNLKPILGFEYVSPSALKITGYSPEEHYNDPMLGMKMVHPDDRHLLQAQQQGIIDSEPLKLRWVKKDGSIIWTESQNIPIYNKKGEIAAIQGKATDITERTQSEQILEARLRLTTFAQTHSQNELQQKLLDELELLTNSSIGFFHAVDADQKTLTLQSWSTNTLQTMCTAESSSQHYGIDKAGVWVDCVRQRKPIIHNDYMSLEHRHELPEGHAPVIRELVVPVFRNEIIVAVVGIGNKLTDYTEKDIDIVTLLADLAWDISQRKGAEEQLNKISIAVDQSPVSVVITDLNGNIEYVNPSFTEFTGYSLHEVYGKNPRILKSGKTEVSVYKDLWTTISSGKKWKGEWINRKKSGEEYWEDVAISPVKGKDGIITNYLAIKQNITQRKETERQIRELNETLEQKVEERTIQLEEALDKLRKIADRLPGMVYQYLLRPDGTSCFPYSSEGIWDIYRVSQKDVIEDASAVFGNLHPDDFDGVAESIQTSANNLKLWQHEYRVKFEDGTIRWLSGNAMPQCEADGSVLWHGFITDITERKQIEDELAIEKQRIDLIIEGNELGTWEWNVQTGETIFNNQWFELIGFTIDEISPVNIKTWRAFVHPDDLVNSDKLLEQHFKGETSNYECHVRMKHKRGNWVWILDRGKVHTWDKEGKPLLMSGTHVNINEQKKVEEELAIEKQRLASILEGTNVGTWEWNVQTGETVFNERWANILGYTLDDISPVSIETWMKFAHPDDLKISGELLDKHFRGETDYYSFESRMKHKNGEWVWVLDRGKVSEWDADGKPLLMSGTHHEITERKQAEEELIWNKSLLELMSNSSPLGFLVVDNRTDEILYFNNRFCQIWEIEHIEEQMKRGEFKNNDLIQYCLPVLIDVTAFAESCKPLQYEDNRIVISDEISFTKNRTVHRYSTQIRGENDEYFGRFYIFEDISERKRADEFENELLQLSIQMTGTKNEDIPQAINNALAKIGSFLFADRAYIFELSEDGITMSNTYEWCCKGIDPEIENLQNLPVDIFPMWMKTLKNKENIQIPSVKDLPDLWSAEREILEQQGIQSLLVIPILNFDKLIGFVGLDSVRSSKTYKDVEIKNLIVWANMMAGIISKQNAEHILTQTRINYETFFNTIDDFLFVLNKHGNIIHINDNVKNRLGYTSQELMDKSVLMVHPAERREEAGRIVGEMLDGSTDFCPVPLQTKQGDLISVETRVKKGFWNGKSVIFGVTKDVSSIKLSEEKFSKAFQSNSALMAITDLEGKFIDVNETFLNVTGFSNDEVIGNNAIELNLLDREKLSMISIEDVKENLPTKDLELEIRTKHDKTVSVLLSADSIYIGKDKHALVFAVDITQRKLAEAEIINARNEAEKANMAKSIFLSRMSHELRTPMNSILGFGQLLQMGKLDPKQNRSINHILSNGRHLLDLINEVLDISAIEAGKQTFLLEPVKLNGVIGEIIDLLKNESLKKELKMEFIDSPSNKLFVMADKKRLKQVMINLISNAIKYNSSKGSIKIKTEPIANEINETAWIRISVIDTGIGISKENLRRLYNPFERIDADKTNTEGTGLGLTVVKQLINAMNGRLGVDSVVGVGSTFWVELPVNSVESFQSVNTPLTESEKNVGINNKGTILYVEDNVLNVELVQEIINYNYTGIKLVTTKFGKEAVSLAIKNKPGLILLDLNLPDLNGDKVIIELLSNKKTKNIPVIILSADAMPEQIENLTTAGARDYITKPIYVQKFIDTVDKWFTYK